jgi:hypothetical protein
MDDESAPIQRPSRPVETDPRLAFNNLQRVLIVVGFAFVWLVTRPVVAGTGSSKRKETKPPRAEQEDRGE